MSENSCPQCGADVEYQSFMTWGEAFHCPGCDWTFFQLFGTCECGGAMEYYDDTPFTQYKVVACSDCEKQEYVALGLFEADKAGRKS